MGWALREEGVTVLENDAVAVRDGLWVAGAADTRHRFPDLEAALGKPPQDAALLLACHDPDLFPQVPARVALTVSGHLHGGQVNIPVLRRPFVPSYFGDRYLAGHVVERGRHLYVSCGVGTSGLPLRLRRPPEVPVLTLIRSALGEPVVSAK
jgi:predicted MPP superfamily phosphohydrolase